uniref:Ras-related protein Rab n=1 Tax=Anopheles culicifacies TaxID=139723 RepID=A0A182LWD2_9DIPT
MEQSPATRRLTRGESEDSPVEFVVVESDVSMSDAGLSSPEKKPKKKRGLSFKKLRSNAQKLIPKRGRKDSSAKSSETSSLGGDSGVVSGGTDELLPATPSPPPPASPTTTETSFDTVLKSTESLPAIKEDPIREAAMLGARSDEDMLLEGKDKQRQKKTRKPSRAASFMKKLAGRSKSSKVAPNPEGTPATTGGGASEGDEISSGTLETPLSIKRQTPEGAMFVSGTELYQDGDREDGTSVDPPSPVLVRQLESEPTALRAKRTEMKITLTRNLVKPSTIETSLDDEETDGGMSNGLNIARNSVTENRELAIDSKPISSDSVSVPSPRVSIGNEQSPQLIAAIRTQQSSSSTSSVDARLSSLLSGDYIAEINKFSIENITNSGAGSIAAGGGGGGSGGGAGEGIAELPPLPQPRASLSIRERFFQQPVVTVTSGSESATNFDSQDVAPPSSIVVDEEIDGFMRKARGASSATGSGGTARSKGGNKSPATVDKSAAGATSGQQQDLSSSSSSSASTSASKAASTVRTQEAAKPYQLGNSLKNPNNSGFKSIEQQRELQQQQQSDQQQDPVNVSADNKGQAENKQDEEQQGDTIANEPAIVFDIGTQVRPDRTSSIVKPAGGRSVAATLAVPSTGLDSGAQSGTFASIGSTSRSLDELIGVGGGGGGSYDDNSQNNTSEGSLRRIAYVEQPTFYTPEEEELLTGKPPRSSSSLLSSALESGEYSLESEDYLESKMSPHGDLLLEKGASDQSATMATGQAEKREHLYKILVIGELGTGKTSFIKRYVHQFFSQNYRATIGVDFALKVLNWDQNTIIRLQLWDIAGQERFGNMTRVYYKEAVGAFIVFDVTRSATFDAVIKWKNDLDSKVQLPDGKPIPCILLANKSDQQKQGIVTTPAKLDEYVKEHGFAGWFETSAKENVNIEEAAKSLVNKILMNDKLLNTGEVIDSERFGLVGTKSDTSQKKSCSC